MLGFCIQMTLKFTQMQIRFYGNTAFLPLPYYISPYFCHFTALIGPNCMRPVHLQLHIGGNNYYTIAPQQVQAGINLRLFWRVKLAGYACSLEGKCMIIE
jgi:hypothetical protein